MGKSGSVTQRPAQGLSCSGGKDKVWGRIQKTLLALCLVAQMVKNPPAMKETWVLSLGWEDSLEKEMATHSSILAWRIPWAEESGRLQSMRLHRVRRD